MYFKKNWDYKHGRKKQQRNDMGQSSKFWADTIPGILHSPYKLQTEYTARIMNTRNIMQLQIKLISKHLFNLLNYVTSANGCFSACLQHSPFYFEVIFKEWQWQCTFKYGDFIYLEVGSICLFFKMLFKKNSTLPHVFQLTFGTQFCDNLVSQVSGEARLYSDGHQETASSWSLEYESLSETKVIKKW